MRPQVDQLIQSSRGHKPVSVYRSKYTFFCSPEDIRTENNGVFDGLGRVAVGGSQPRKAVRTRGRPVLNDCALTSPARTPSQATSFATIFLNDLHLSLRFVYLILFY